ncbi:OmpA/MotB domain-containing protein [Hydrogenophaga taeniospiralis CCUG 15921]|uniref:OmpA/MotB domain-containing protein n=1 Tax=Hydrogenophaga taeniospiralis CCUG 15921 TaxID=1281780 RepID=A0A9X4NTD4_9BURK|nr:OmpA family protein [Hydrogenophaga taeniospiralis]MDG5976304.1 OmpA/MotB domain-containing protein [Hydrogenophaga taeniospiralis CCUG 15921]
MSSQDNDQDALVVAAVLIAAIVLVLGVAVGVAMGQVRGASAATVAEEGAATPVASSAAATAPVAAAPAAVTPPAPEPAPVAPRHDDASVVVENGVVKFYFASGQADLAPGALDALEDAIAAAKAGKRLVLSGFHDATGDPVTNAALAKRRALAVRDALVGAGVSTMALELKKPEESTGSGNDAEARRVEVTIVD